MEENKRILHELYVFSEWKPEPEYLQKPDSFLPENLSTLWRWFKFFGPKKSLIDSVTAYKEKQPRWHIALGDEGKVIAIVTDNILEIRTKRSEYATIAARTTVSRDGYSQWRKIVWSPDCSLLALAYGNGVISFFDLTASNLYNIAAECSKPGGMECTDNTHAVADIIFMPLRVKDNKWSWEVLVVLYDGSFRGFLASQTEVSQHQRGRLGAAVSAARLCEQHRLLLVATLPRHKDPSTALGAGLTAWRVLNDDPFYKLSVVSDQLEDDGLHKYIPFLAAKNMAFIVDMAMSPDQSKLVCIHCNGEVSVWGLPLLKLLHRYPLVTQPQNDLKNTLIKEEKLGKKDVSLFYPADVNWWSNEELILSRFSGVVSVCNINDLVNILGKKPEFFQGAPQITCAYHGTFMVLECETNILPAKKSRSDESMEVVKPEEDYEDSLLDVATELLKSVLYVITDMEAFQPRPRRLSVVARVYRLLAVRSTTPQDLFNRKIESGQYSEALVLASTFGLDSDLVYQQQWRKHPVSSAAIHNYLSKVSKKIWAVHQCVDRLPETLPAAKELLQFGLQLTNEKILEDINNEREGDPIEDVEDITLEDLNAYTSELLRCRHVMLFYKERLSLYEAILKCEKSNYVKDEYDRLRSNSIVHTAMEIAKEGRIEALTCLWPHIKTTALQLEVLEKLPETINPLDYQHLLPTKEPITLFEKKSPIKMPPSEHEHDWCRKEIFRSIWSSNWSEDTTPDSETSLSYTDDVSKWYDKRAREIEHRSGLVSHALTLVTLAAVGGAVAGLDRVLFHLLTLDTLVYDINVEGVTLGRLEKMTVLDTCGLLMKMSTPASFVSDLKKFVVPFLKRHENLARAPAACLHGLMDYLENLSVYDLSYILLVLQSPTEFELDVSTHLELAERCLFAYQGTDQLDMACDLLDTILKESDGSISSVELRRRVSYCSRVVRGAARVWGSLRATPRALRAAAGDRAQAWGLVTRLTQATSDEKPTKEEWEQILSDILYLQETILTVITKEECYEIYARALLSSGDLPSIRLSSSVLCCGSSAPAPLPAARSAELVSTAARDYFNSASDLNDPALDMARCCLQLIKDDNPEIQQELDLISALKILSSFGVSLLPVQVRLCEDKLSLINECMNSDPNAYMASHKLLKLAALLRIAGDDEHAREVVVTRLVCGGALAAGAAGGSAASAAALRLAQLADKHSAHLLEQVSRSPHCAPHAAAARPRLLAAAAATTRPANIAGVLTARLQIELEGLQEVSTALKEHTKFERAPSTDDEYCDAVTTPVVERKDIVAPPKSEQTPLFSYLMSTFQNKFVSSTESKPDSPRALHCPEFYHSLYPELSVSPDHYRYDGFSPPAPRGPGRDLAACYYTQSCLEDWADGSVEAEVIHKCACDLLHCDSALSVCCFLRVLSRGRAGGARGCTDTAVQMYAALLRCNEESYLVQPAELARKTLKENNAPENLLQLIRSCIDKLSGMGEVDTLRDLGFTVNGLMFNADEDYRNEIIYRVARSPSQEHVAAALSLASRYSLDPLEVWLQHAAAAIQEQRPMLPPPGGVDDAHQRISASLWPLVPGSDHHSLINYFSCLRAVDEKPNISGMTADKHVKLLKKVKAACKELDYKLLISSPPAPEFTAHLLSVVRADNIALVCKLLRSLPTNIKIPITVQELYCAWLTKYLFSVSPSSASNKKWQQQFRTCASYFTKLGAAQLRNFIENACFSGEAVQRIRVESRAVMASQAADYCLQELENDAHAHLTTSPGEASWQAVLDELSSWAHFLQTLVSPAARNIADEYTLTDTELWIELEKSHGDPAKITHAFSRILLEKQMKCRTMMVLIEQLCKEVTIDDVFKDALDICRSEESHIPTLIDLVILYHKEAKLSDDVIQCTLQLSTHAPPHKQIALMSLAGRAGGGAGGGGGGADEGRVAEYCVEVLKTEWPGVEGVKDVTAEQLTTESGRSSVFSSLLPVLGSWRARKALVDVINCWPSTTMPSGRSVQCEFLLAALRDNSRDALVLIKLLLPGTTLADEEIKWLAQEAKGDAIINVIWIMLLANCEQYKDDIVKLAMLHKDVIQESEIEDELIKELLDNGLFIKLVPTPLYASIINFILNKEAAGGEPINIYSVKWATDQLVQNNCLAEAGHLHLMSIGVPTALHGFTQAVFYSKRLFSKK